MSVVVRGPKRVAEQVENSARIFKRGRQQRQQVTVGSTLFYDRQIPHRCHLHARG